MAVTTMLTAAAAVMAVLLLTVKVLALPVKVSLRAFLNALLGIGSLFLVNAASAFTGWAVRIDPFSILAACVFGVPGVGMVFMLRWMLT